ncbi:thiamine diphosphate-binding fold [Arabidopsis suecica]|uniref:Thiamine diphosphate-binding fold n=1 Tax=Arabidopsis suecica TaxID=45249 RepID=A0A8T2BMS5_ARASU|nr:thiamine diphosphate-binding fold [Arabidopsis suecica]KAG7587690.1 thiamine diphosphate-binding fold [Arabidopsis suecica]
MDLKRIVNCFRSDWLLLLSSNLLVLSPLILLADSITPPPLSISRRHCPRSLRRRNPPSCSSKLLKGIANVQALRSSRLLITKEKGLELYEDMILGRSVEDMCAQMSYRGKMFGFVHLYNGHEGDMCLVLVEDMCAHLYIRDHVHALIQGHRYWISQCRPSPNENVYT